MNERMPGFHFAAVYAAVPIGLFPDPPADSLPLAGACPAPLDREQVEAVLVQTGRQAVPLQVHLTTEGRSSACEVTQAVFG